MISWVYGDSVPVARRESKNCHSLLGADERPELNVLFVTGYAEKIRDGGRTDPSIMKPFRACRFGRGNPQCPGASTSQQGG